jgi:hypothetical protein
MLNKENFVLVKIIREMAEDYATDLRNSDKSINIVFSCSKELKSSSYTD